MTWLGPLLFVYVIISTLFWIGASWYEAKHPYEDKQPIWKWCFTLFWPVMPFIDLYQKAVMRWHAWRVKRLIRKFMPSHIAIADELFERIKKL